MQPLSYILTIAVLAAGAAQASLQALPQSLKADEAKSCLVRFVLASPRRPFLPTRARMS